MPTALRCACPCHSRHAADRESHRQHWDFSNAFLAAQLAHHYEGVSVTDPVEAVTACRTCLTIHCPALLPRIVWARYPAPPKVTADPTDPTPYTNNPGGATDGSEGTE